MTEPTAEPMLKKLFIFSRDTYRSRSTILELVRRDFRVRYLGSYLGLTWAFVHPLVTILVFWFIFDMGFKARPVADVPFILWLVSGIVAWFCFSDAWSSANVSILESSYLVSKVVFRVSLLPIVKIVSALVVHCFLLGVTVLFFMIYGFYPDLTYLQIPYYMLGMTLLLLGLSWLTSALTVFVRDLGQVLAIVLQLMFWMTPILWSLGILPEKFHDILRLNPMFYIVEGYRNCFIHHVWFWQDPWMTLYFWAFTGTTLALGAFTFMRLRPHFADVV